MAAATGARGVYPNPGNAFLIDLPIETAGALIVFPFLMVIGAGYVFALLGLLPKFAGWVTVKVGWTTVGTLLSEWGPLGMMCLLFGWLIWKSRSLAKMRRKTTAEVIVPNDLLPRFLKTASEAIPEEFGESLIESVTRAAQALLDKRRSEITFPVKSGEKPGRLDLNIRRINDIFVLTFSGNKCVVDSVREALRVAWQRLLDDEAREVGK